jgi:hypothetical protein
MEGKNKRTKKALCHEISSNFSIAFLSSQISNKINDLRKRYQQITMEKNQAINQ